MPIMKGPIIDIIFNPSIYHLFRYQINHMLCNIHLFIRQKSEILKINIVLIEKSCSFSDGLLFYWHECLFFDGFGHFHIVF